MSPGSPDFSFHSAVGILADQIHPDHHSCGDVAPHGHQELAQAEKGLYLVGMKSYGRAPSFLAMPGVEQVRAVVAALDNDLAAADRVELVLPEKGVCDGASPGSSPEASNLRRRLPHPRWRR